MSDQHLKATYISPDANCNKSFSAKLPSLLPDANELSVEDKTAYLNALRAKISQMQGEVNAFLTQRMEEEKAPGNVKKQVREQKEEEMYGEEDPEEEFPYQTDTRRGRNALGNNSSEKARGSRVSGRHFIERVINVSIIIFRYSTVLRHPIS